MFSCVCIDCLCCLKKNATAAAVLFLFPKSVKSQYCSHIFFSHFFVVCLVFFLSPVLEIYPSEPTGGPSEGTFHVLTATAPISSHRQCSPQFSPQTTSHLYLNDSETQSSHDLIDPDTVAPYHDRERGLSDER